ncbi:cytochrome P450, partial [Streptococcus pyogenes]
MTSTIPEAIANIDLADGNFYADRRASLEAYRWMRANQPVFRDRNGLPGAHTYQAIHDPELNPALFSSPGGIRPDHP